MFRMTNDGSNERPLQEFRAYGSSKIIAIETIYNKITGEQVVRWKDIKRIFKNAEHLMYGGTSINFMTGDDLEDLDPPRIQYRPGIVLDVYMAGSGSSSALYSGDFISQQPQIATPNVETIVFMPSDKASGSPNPQQDLIEDVANMNLELQRCTGLESIDESLVVHPALLTRGSRRSLHEFQQLRLSYFQARTSGETNLATSVFSRAESVKEAIEQSISLEHGMDENGSQKDIVLAMRHIYGMLQEMKESQLQLHERMEANHQETLRAHQESDELQKRNALLQQEFHELTRETIIRVQGGVQALLTQNYELHENPIPRLFIILPKAKRLRDKLGKPFSDQFRLFFLCECGEHTMAEGSKIPHEIHLARHEGYDVEKPKELFEEYGSYILALMEIIKYGVAVGSAVMPALSHFKISENIEQIKEYVDLTEKTISGLVDESITFLKDQQTNTMDGIENGGDRPNYDKLEALAGADLRRLETYLSIKDKGRVLGNLYRIVTLEGHVKWVCIDHYRENYKEKAMHHLKDVIVANNGKFLEEKGNVVVSVASSTKANEFYKALANSRGVQELDIILAWDVTLEDLRNFHDAVSKANIIHLTVDGTKFVGPTLNLLNRGRRYDPLMELMSNGRIQSLQLKRIDNIFQRVSISSIVMAPRLRILKIAIIDFDDKTSRSILEKILECCPSLIELELEATKMDQPFKIIMEKLSALELLGIAAAPSADGAFELSLDFLKSTETLANNREVSRICLDNIMKVKINVATNQYDIPKHPIFLKELSRQYGPSIKHLDLRGLLNDSLAKVLDEVTMEKHFTVTTLIMDSGTLSSTGIGHMVQVIDRLMQLDNLGLSFNDLEDKYRLEKLEYLLKRHGKKLNALTLYVGGAEKWMPGLAESFPKRAEFPRLRDFQICCYDGAPFPRNCIQWVSDMISNPVHFPTPLSGDRMQDQDSVTEQSPRHSIDTTETCQHLKKFCFEDALLRPEDWATVIEALDMSELEDLSFQWSNISLEQLEHLGVRLASSTEDGSTTSSLSLDLRNTSVVKGTDASVMTLLNHIREKSR
ncbi:hypothetical protein BGZ79_008564 [Entomortierella chlamydospora]|nr:hypothetical protein BGZ79_008564 [Entomortierella chlamydospora]